MARKKQKPPEQREREAEASRHRDDEVSPVERGEPGSAGGDKNMSGAPGGGSALGGLAGTNVGAGGTADVNLDDALGSGQFDVELEQEDEPPYSGHSGGAVGGAPAGKRASGGRMDHGLSPGQGHRGESTIGSDPGPGKPR